MTEEKKLSWYVVHTYSGFEEKAKQMLEERIKQENLVDKFGEVLIPSEEVVQLVEGKRKVSHRKFFPGYILVQMFLNEETFALVKGTPKVTGFVGGTLDAPAIPEDEAARLTQRIKDGINKPKMKEQLDRGDVVRVIDGPFANFNGVVDEVKPEKGKVRVLVSIFGRQTPVELDFVQVEKS
jgi:transcriptional antiterminator NusG